MTKLRLAAVSRDPNEFASTWCPKPALPTVTGNGLRFVMSMHPMGGGVAPASLYKLLAVRNAFALGQRLGTVHRAVRFSHTHSRVN